MTGTDHQDIGLSQDHIQCNKGGIGNEGIGADDPPALRDEALAQLVSKGAPQIIAICLEGHAQDADGLIGQTSLGLQLLDDEAGQAFIDRHGSLAEQESLIVELG